MVNPAAVLRLQRPKRRTLRGRLPGHPEDSGTRTIFQPERARPCTKWKLKGAGSITLPAPMWTNKEQTPSQVVIAAATGVSRWTFRCFGHTSSEALRLLKRGKSVMAPGPS